VILLVLVIYVNCQNDDKMQTLSFHDGIDRRKFYANNLTIDYETCGQVFYDYEYYKDEGCHRTQLPNVTIQEKFGEGIAACCGIHGYMASGSCMGKTKEGEKVRLENIDVCHDPAHIDYDDHSIHHPLDYELMCLYSIYSSGRLDKADGVEIIDSPDEDGKVLKIKDFLTKDFCVGYACGDNGWDIKYKASIPPKEISQHNDDLMSKIQQTLRSSSSPLPLCCSREGFLYKRQMLHKFILECHDNGRVMDVNETESKGAYHWSGAKLIDLDPDPAAWVNNSKLVCVSVSLDWVTTTQPSLRGVTGRGREPCDGKTPCFAACNAAGQGWNERGTEALDNHVTFSEIIGIQGLDESVGGNIDYSLPSYCKTVAANLTQIYPENKYQHRVEFHDDSLMTMVDTGEVFHYRQFCLSLNQRAVAEKKGRFMVQLCLTTSKSTGNEKFWGKYLEIFEEIFGKSLKKYLKNF